MFRTPAHLVAKLATARAAHAVTLARYEIAVAKLEAKPPGVSRKGMLAERAFDRAYRAACDTSNAIGAIQAEIFALNDADFDARLAANRL